MGFFDSLKSLLGGAGASIRPGDGAYWLYVRCKRCGEVIKTRLDLQNNLSQNEEGGYTAHKTLVGSHLCFERIEVILNFDKNRQLISQDIVHGDFISAEEFEAVQNKP